MYHSDPQSFVSESAKYGPIGQAIVNLSDLEFSHDRFVLAFLEYNRDLALEISKNFPRHYKKKTDYLVCAVAATPALRRVPMFDDGELNLLWLQYQLDELYDFRAAIAHGSIFYSETYDDGALWRFDRVTSKQKGYWSTHSTTVGSAFLAAVSKTSNGLRRYIENLRLSIEGRFDWEEVYKDEIEMRKNRAELRELIELGVMQPSPLLAALT